MNFVPKVAAFQDISGLGRCSLTVVLPVLAAMGSQCCPLPTALLSAHTGFPNPTFLDLTGELEGIVRHWTALQVRFDAVYSGFLGSARQMEILRRFLDALRGEDTLVLVDPVMGDHGRLYRTYTPEMCRKMGELAAQADLITPNLTEAALLLGEDYAGIPVGRTKLEDWLRRLSLEGGRSVVLTGVSLAPGEVGACCLDRATGETGFFMARQEAGVFSGTGDLFASVVLGGLLRGQSLCGSMALAVEFVRKAVARTLAAGTPVLEGVQFEPLLGDLVGGAPAQ